MVKYGLVGHPLGHSFSKKFFNEKFEAESISGHSYDQFDLPSIESFPSLWEDNELHGVNVTIPYKEDVFHFLDSVDPSAKEIGAVNVIKKSDGKLTGFNSDFPAFKETIENWLKPSGLKALVLGTGGASKAIKHALKGMGIEYMSVSRTAGPRRFTYDELKQNPEILSNHRLIVNTTPLGTFPNVETKPDLPYSHISRDHFLYDLVYNPEVTAYLQEGLDAGAQIKNGYEMLVRQAELSWQIWKS